MEEQVVNEEIELTEEMGQEFTDGRGEDNE